MFVDSPEEASSRAGRPGPDYPVLLTPRDTAGEKVIEVFRGAGEGSEPLELTALEAVIPARVDAGALEAGLKDLAAFVRGERATTSAELEAVIRGVLPGFRHVAAEARLDDRV